MGNQYLDNNDAEFDCLYYNIPNKPISITFGGVSKVDCPEATEDSYYILVSIWGDDLKDIGTYRISLTEPKYIYGSDALPAEYRDLIIDRIIDLYRIGIKTINDYLQEQKINPETPMPDYNLL